MQVRNFMPSSFVLCTLFALILALLFCGQAGAVTPTISTPTTSNLVAGQVTLSLTSNQNGTGYFVIVGSAETTPTAAQTKAGQNAGGTVTRHGSLSLTANVAGTYTVRNLAASTAYKVVFTAEDTSANLQGTVATAAFTTPAIGTMAATWADAGSTRFTSASFQAASMAVAPDGTLYVAYTDYEGTYSGKATVKKLNGSSWQLVGNQAFSSGLANYIKIAFAPDGTPYVAYADDGNSSYVTVKKLSGSTWAAVGSMTIPAQYTNLAFAPDGMPYAAFGDMTTSTYKVTIMKFSGTTWSQVGSSLAATGGTYWANLTVAPDGTPYVAYQDLANGQGATLQKYIGSSWGVVGAVNLSGVSASDINVVVAPNGTPYVSYSGGVKYYNGSWTSLGNYVATTASNPRMAIAPDGTPYVAYGDDGSSSRMTVKKYSSGWAAVGNTLFSTGYPDAVCTTIGPDGSIFVAYYDYGTSVSELKKLAAASSAPPPSVSGISPSSGPLGGGTAVTITGSSFVNGATVTIGGMAATNVTFNSATSLSATTPSGTAGAKNVVVTNPDAQAGTLTNGFTYVAAPTVTGISPTGGPLAGNTAVTITGTNLTGATSVTIGGIAATAVTVVNATTITATTPAGTAGARDVAVTTSGGTGTGTGLFTYYAVPTVTGISPTAGSVAGGTGVTITGTNFTGATSVTIGGVAATGITVVNATTITASTPAGSAGARNVAVTTPGGTGTGTGLFTYYALPTVTGISPTGGPLTGGTTVTITGANLTGATAVTIGGAAATAVSVVNATTITATTPAGTAGAKDVVVITPGGSGTGTGLFTYYAIPTVTGITPNVGPIAGGTPVTITGTNLVGATSVAIGGVAATGITVVNATTITATTPAGTAGIKDVTVTTPGGTATGSGLFTYYALPTVTGINPTGGPVAGGTSVTITGTNLIGATNVTIGGAAATAITVVNATTITATTPAGTAGARDVAVTTPGGTGTGTGLFTYYALPTVTGITPNVGPIAGGTSVTITGTNLTGATSVTIGGNTATGITVVNATTITATTPTGSAGAKNVVVTTPGGTGSGTGIFTYFALPTVTGISPTAGPIAGGTAVTVTGTNLTGTTSVAIGGVAATAVTVVDATTITATTPAGTAGARDVTVTTPGGIGTGVGLFTYYAIPTVTGISPGGGPLSGGTTVTVTGTNLTGATSVTIGGVAATGITVVNATTITASTTAGSAGAKNVVVTTPGGTGSGTGLFTYYDVPAVSGVSPSSGPTNGGTSVIITGTNLTGATSVKFGSTNAASFTVNSATQITATSPAGSAGIVDITVTNLVATSATKAVDGFTYLAVTAPTVTGISPTIGPVSGGTPVTITGTSFAGATAVLFGSASAPFTVNSTTQITAMAPIGAAGTVDMTVVTPGGTSATSAADRFTYAAATASVVIDPNDSAKLYAGLDGAGVYRSSDSGGNWTNATTQPANLRIKALVIDKTDSTKLFAASYGGGVFKSTDSGDTWSACANSNLTNLNLVSLTIDGSGKLYAGTEAGVFVSTDNCTTWNALNTGLPN